MSRDKQIEEMTKIICRSNTDGICGYDRLPCDFNCGNYQLATIFYTAGYRKASDLAEEIFAEIREQLVEYFNGKDKEYTTMRTKSTKQLQIATAHYQGATNAIVFALNALAELKKKYESEGVE